MAAPAGIGKRPILSVPENTRTGSVPHRKQGVRCEPSGTIRHFTSICPAPVNRWKELFRPRTTSGMTFDPIKPKLLSMRFIPALLFLLLATTPLRAALPEFDFTTPAGRSGWAQPHDVELSPAPEGLSIRITGADPYFSGPPRDYPTGESLWLLLEINSQTGGTAQFFHFQQGPSEENSIRFYVPSGGWTTLRVPLPALGPQTRLRFDPPGTTGTCLLRKITFEPRPKLELPTWTKPLLPQLAASSPALTSGDLALVHGDRLGEFELRVNGRPMAIGHSAVDAGYLDGKKQVWFNLSNRVTLSRAGAVLSAKTVVKDPGGAEWQIEQNFRPSPQPGGLEVETLVTVSADRDVTFLPMLALFPGAGSFGTNKTQGLFAGVEYLDNEPSSSEADVIGPGALRRVPDSLKLTFPLMAVAAQDRYLALTWEQQPAFAALYDSPDRVFHSGGHLMALIHPGSTPDLREDGRLLPYAGVKLKAGEPLRLRATILGGAGNSVVPAVQEYVRRRGLPPRPKPVLSKLDYFRLAASGWLDSRIRDGNRFRHAVGGNFGSQPAADAALLMQRLSLRVDDPSLSAKLKSTASEALAGIPPHAYNSMAVGHVRSPVQPLVLGSVHENSQTSLAEGRNVLRHFEPDGSVLYKPSPGRPDFGKTHFSREANGLAANYVWSLLERASFSGDRKLIEEGLRLLAALDKFLNTVPRGAQTWEMPLHTPDILASAYLVRAYTRGYELTRKPEFLAAARYWAWTGVPFLYLTAPNDKHVGVYSTIAVLGATHWVAPLWIGLPVQWCGLVYSHAIRHLAPYDSSAPWREIADGIALAGVQHTHPASDEGLGGLLPDSFELRNQVRNPVPINPATVLVEALEAYGEPPLYSFHSFPHRGVLVHAPGTIQAPRESGPSLRFKVHPWPQQGSYVLVNGVGNLQSIRLDGVPHEPPPGNYNAAAGQLVLPIQGACEVELQLPVEAPEPK